VELQVDAATDIDNADPVPLGHRFDVVWRGYHRRQVNEYVNLQLRWLTEDRDAAMEMVRSLTELLEESRSETRLARERLDRVCRTPLSPDAVSERLCRQVAIAQAEAARIVTTARARAEHIRVEAAEDAVRQAAAAERRRREAEEDFQIAMAERRAAIMRRLREHEAACRAEADQLVRDASQAAAQQLASARAQVESLRGLQQRLARRLRLAHGLLMRASALVEPRAGEAASG
jgi:colicin import membrane protein